MGIQYQVRALRWNNVMELLGNPNADAAEKNMQKIRNVCHESFWRPLEPYILRLLTSDLAELAEDLSSIDVEEQDRERVLFTRALLMIIDIAEGTRGLSASSFDGFRGDVDEVHKILLDLGYPEEFNLDRLTASTLPLPDLFSENGDVGSMGWVPFEGLVECLQADIPVSRNLKTKNQSDKKRKTAPQGGDTPTLARWAKISFEEGDLINSDEWAVAAAHEMRQWLNVVRYEMCEQLLDEELEAESSDWDVAADHCNDVAIVAIIM